jgi:hypothetical protein
MRMFTSIASYRITERSARIVRLIPSDRGIGQDPSHSATAAPSTSACVEVVGVLVGVFSEPPVSPRISFGPPGLLNRRSVVRIHPGTFLWACEADGR